MIKNKKGFSFSAAMKDVILCVLCALSVTCKDDQAVQPPRRPHCGKDALLALSRLTMLTLPPPPGTTSDSIKCPLFNFWERPFHIGDTLAVTVSQDMGAQIIGDKPVTVMVRTMFGDTESYLLRSGFWPCEMRAVDVEIYRAITTYNSVPLGGPPYPFPNNGQLEIRTTGDTLMASYVSYCSGDTLRDSVAVIPK